MHTYTYTLYTYIDINIYALEMDKQPMKKETTTNNNRRLHTMDNNKVNNFLINTSISSFNYGNFKQTDEEKQSEENAKVEK